MKAYKASYNGKCQSLKYEVGKTYTFNGELVMCSAGFHFCNNLDDLLAYYPMRKDLKIFEIDVLGEVITQGNKSVTNKLKVIKTISLVNFKKQLKNYKFDKKNNLVHCKHSSGVEYWNDYDKKNNLVHYKNSSGTEEWNDFDKKNNLVHYKNSNGNEYSIEIN